jgi:hypothetical protein
VLRRPWADGPSHALGAFFRQDWLYNSINQFSAACWHFAEHLTDIAERNNETVVPFGLVSSQWGGTIIENWQPNVSLNAGVCK